MSIPPLSIRSSISEIWRGVFAVSDAITASRASGNSEAASSASRSTPGPQALNRSSAPQAGQVCGRRCWRSEEHTSELQSLMRNSYAVFCLKNKKYIKTVHRLDMYTTDPPDTQIQHTHSSDSHIQ